MALRHELSDKKEWNRDFSPLVLMQYEGCFLFYTNRRERRPRRSGRRRRQFGVLLACAWGVKPDGTPGTAFPTLSLKEGIYASS